MACIERCSIIKIDSSGWISVDGFDADNCTCREMAHLAITKAISILTMELEKSLIKPGSARISVD